MSHIRKQILTVLKILAIILFITIFLALGLIAMNNTVKNMTGESLRVLSNSDGIIVDVYGKGYLIDYSPFQQVKEWIQEHWILIPRSIRFIQYIADLL